LDARKSKEKKWTRTFVHTLAACAPQPFLLTCTHASCPVVLVMPGSRLFRLAIAKHVAAVICLALVGAHGWPAYKDEIPNGHSVVSNGVAWGGVGHASAAGGGDRNPFGIAFLSAGSRWALALCQADSDGDGQTNGMELGDPDCTWTKGGVPKRSTDISHPGIADSKTKAASPGAVARRSFL
jgi:hypothetical protein